MLDGSRGAVMAKIMKTLVMYGDAFGAERMVPVTSRYGHTVISFGLGVMDPVYDLYDEILSAGILPEQKFTADPKPLDPNVPSSPLEDLVFKKLMYNRQSAMRRSFRSSGSPGTRTIPAPAISTRWATSRRRVRSFPGRRVRPWSMPIPSSARAATAIPAFWS